MGMIESRRLVIERGAHVIVSTTLAIIVLALGFALRESRETVAEQGAIIHDMAGAIAEKEAAVEQSGQDLQECRQGLATVSTVGKWLADELRENKGTAPPCVESALGNYTIRSTP